MRVVRGEVRDAYSRDGETVLMIDTTVMLLSPLASLIWDVCDSARTEDELVAVLVDAFGAPPGGDPLTYVRETIESLEAAGALSRL